jgi:NADPH:quinone reductase-like Zn-dependent oxidoreductase
MAPETTDQYTIDFKAGLDDLKLRQDIPIPSLGEHECLVEIGAVSLNFRDLAMVTRLFSPGMKEGVIPCSDSAGTVIAVGSKVQESKAGDKLCNTFFATFEYGPLTAEARASALGSGLDGVLSRHGVFPDTGLVLAPKSLTTFENSTLPCAALTAWNALFGLEGRKLKAGECFLTQGTGGVSVFDIQFALAVGATVIATTSSAKKTKKLREMGVQHVINYREDQNWGETARKLSPGGLGAQHIIEVRRGHSAAVI